MVFWLGILVGGAFAWLAIKMGFYETWALLFNIIISIYLAVFLGPIIADIAPIARGTAYNNALCMLATAIAAFLILHGISYTFLTGQFTVSFPKIFNTIGTGFLGFLSGFLVWTFVSLLISITPISQQPIAKEIGFGSQFEQTNVPYICWWCNLVSTVVSPRDNEYTTEQAIGGLLNSGKKKAQAQMAKQAESAEPNKPAEPKAGISEEEQPGPPPKADTEDI